MLKSRLKSHHALTSPLRGRRRRIERAYQDRRESEVGADNGGLGIERQAMGEGDMKDVQVQSRAQGTRPWLRERP